MGALSRLIKKPFRKQRLAAKLRSQIRQTSDWRIMVGASGTEQEGWISTEQDQVDLLDPETWAKFFDSGSLEAVIAEHVWEHLTIEQGIIAAQTCFQFLKPGAYLRVAVPDGNHPEAEYIEYVRPGGSGPGADDHKVLYNFRSFGEVFRRAGFEVRLIEYFDDQRKFHTADWDVSKGLVRRTLLFDERNKVKPYGYTSIFLDAAKPESASLPQAA